MRRRGPRRRRNPLAPAAFGSSYAAYHTRLSHYKLLQCIPFLCNHILQLCKTYFESCPAAHALTHVLLPQNPTPIHHHLALIVVCDQDPSVTHPALHNHFYGCRSECWLGIDCRSRSGEEAGARGAEPSEVGVVRGQDRTAWGCSVGGARVDQYFVEVHQPHLPKGRFCQ